MPVIDLYLPECALNLEAERGLAEKITALILTAEGAWLPDEDVFAGSWTLVHHTQVYAGGAPAAEPRYRVDAYTPQGLINDPEVRERLVADITEAVLDAEGPDRPRDPSRVFVFPLEIPERRWGWGGRLIGLKDVPSPSSPATPNRPGRRLASASENRAAEAPTRPFRTDEPHTPGRTAAGRKPPNDRPPLRAVISSTRRRTPCPTPTSSSACTPPRAT
ncbi:hypothetical protein [Streptomyces sp. NPDC003996]